MVKEKQTPLMIQYWAIREQYPDAVLLFQVGDFYELFFDDAINISRFLGIALTKRGKANGKDIPLCGVPVHALQHYLLKLIKGGFKVALCDQLTKPQPGKVVERGVTQVFTPGTLTDTQMLDDKSASYLLSFYPGKSHCGMIFTELLTAQMFATAVPIDAHRMMEAELARFSPDEIIIPDVTEKKFGSYFRQQGYVVSLVNTVSPNTGRSFETLANANPQDERREIVGCFESGGAIANKFAGVDSLRNGSFPARPEGAAKQRVSKDHLVEMTGNNDIAGTDIPTSWVENQFSDAIVKRLSDAPTITHSLHLLYWYLKKNQEQALDQLKTVHFYQPEDYLILDAATQKNLEIIKNVHDGGRKNTLFSVVDKAVTAMGSRTIKKWLQRPLVQKNAIMQRQEMVVSLSQNIEAMQKLEQLLGQIADLERIVGRIALRRALLQDYLALKQSLVLMPEIKQLLQHYFMFQLSQAIQDKIRNFDALVELLSCALNDDTLNKWVIKKGFDQELDRLRGLVDNSQQAVLQLEQREIERTGIASLKIRYNNIAGYYIEVTKPNLSLVPVDYIQQQTLVNRNRYVTQELKDLERDIIKAQNEIDVVEQVAFDRVKKTVEDELPPLRQLAQALSYLDALLGFACVAYDNGYVAPTFTDKRDIVITKGRHPVVEAASSSQFIPNDTHLTEEESIWILTGPNMGGKSTYLRQVALLCIMAQAGSLVPAQAAKLPILDRVFTRIGSGDNLAQGKSTFLIEMEETAAICNQATKNSLVILDEVGRGTSTFDGMALAQAIIEYIAEHVKARCLFATHYHELTHLKDHFSEIENYHMASKRTADGVLFLYKILKGVSNGSFGIEVAKLAQLPKVVIARATTILQSLSELEIRKDDSVFPAIQIGKQNGKEIQLQQRIAELEKELAQKAKALEDLKGVSLDDLSPRQAFDLIWKLKQKGA